MTNDEAKKVFAENLVNYLRLNGKTQVKAAEELGVSQQAMNFWCSGVNMPRMDKLDLLCEYFHVSRYDLLNKSAPDELKYSVQTAMMMNNIKHDEQLARVLTCFNCLNEDEKNTIEIMVHALANNHLRNLQ